MEKLSPILNRLWLWLRIVIALRTPFVWLQDREYVEIPLKTLMVEFSTLQGKLPLPTVDRFDCDDFAIVVKAHFVLRGWNGIGIIWGLDSWTIHCWMVVLTDKGIVQFEPQTGQIKHFRKRIAVLCIV